MWGLSLLSTGIGLYQQEKQRIANEKLLKQNQAVQNQNLMNNRLAEDQSKFRDYEYSGVPFRSVNFAKGGSIDGDPKDAIYGNIHYTSRFKPNTFNLAKNGAVSGKWSTPGVGFFKRIANVDVILPILDIIRQDIEIRNSDNPDETKKKINKESKRIINSLSDPDNPLYQPAPELANGGLLNFGTDSIGVNSQGGTSGSHEQGDNIHLLNSVGQSVNIEPGEVVVDGNYALSKRNPTYSDSFADRYLKHKGDSVSMLASSKKTPDIVKANELRRLSEIEESKAKLIKPEQEAYNATNNKEGYAGIPTNQMQAGGWLERSGLGKSKAYSELTQLNKNYLDLYVEAELEKLKKDNPSFEQKKVTEIPINKVAPKLSTINNYTNKYKTQDIKTDSDSSNSNVQKQGIGTYAGDILNTGLALYEAFRKSTTYPGAQLTPTPSYRRLNPYGRIGNISNEVSKATRDVDLSTSNSQVSRAAKQNILLAGMDAKNKYLSEIEDKNIANDNQFASIDANIIANNANAINANNLGKYSANEARRENLINMVSGIGASISNKFIDNRNFNNKLALDKEINKINIESGERIAKLNAESNKEQMDMIIRASGDPEAYLIVRPQDFNTFDDFVAKFKYKKSREELLEIWNRHIKQ